MPPVNSLGRTSRWINATGEPWIKWQEVSQIGKGRDPKTQSMRDKRKVSLWGFTEAVWHAGCVDAHGRRCNHVLAFHQISKWQVTMANACVQSDRSFQLPSKGRADRSEPWTKEETSLPSLYLYSAKPRITLYEWNPSPTLLEKQRQCTIPHQPEPSHFSNIVQKRD